MTVNYLRLGGGHPVIESHIIHNEVAASIDVTLRVTPDPTASTPEFALSARSASTPGTFVDKCAIIECPA